MRAALSLLLLGLSSCRCDGLRLCASRTGLSLMTQTVYEMTSTRAAWPCAAPSGPSHVTRVASSASANATYMAS